MTTDNCVANKMIDGKQCTIIWLVDNNCINNMSDSVQDMVIGPIKAKFGKLKVTRGKEHVFLGVNLPPYSILPPAGGGDEDRTN